MAIVGNSQAARVPYRTLNFEPIYQIDPRLREEIRKYGCRFMCMITIAAIINGVPYTAEQVEYIYSQASTGALGEKVMESNCACGENEHKLINLGFQILGDSKHTCRQIYISDCADQHKNQSDLPSQDNVTFIIVDFKTGSDPKTYGGHHFVLYNGIGELLYDPAKNTVTSLKYMNRWLVYKVFTN